jgi:hypothetical protein
LLDLRSRMKTLRLALAALFVACATAAPRATGDWQSANGFLSVEPSRLVWFDPAHNDLSVATILQRGDELVTRHRGRLERVRLTRRGDELHVSAGGQTTAYHRIAAPPAAMSLTPLALAPSAPLAAEKVEAIRAEIAKRNAADQQLLRSKAPHEQIQAVQEANDAWLRETALRYGWIDAERFGAKAAGAAIVMAKHSADMRLLLAALPTMERDLARDPAAAQTFAIAYDQLLLSLGQRQRFGSQICAEPNGQHPFLCAVETPSRLGERRAAIGLEPLGDYLALVSKMLYKGEPVRVPTDAERQ